MESKNNSTPDVYQRVNQLIMARLEQGVAPWQQPWQNTLPQNYLSKKPYRGINCFLLNLFNFQEPYFLTFQQASDLGGKVIKNSKALPVVYWNWLYIDPITQKSVPNPAPQQLPLLEKVPLLRYYNVFNISQIEGIKWQLPQVQPLGANLSIQTAERLLHFMQPQLPPIRVGGSSAYYTPPMDYIQIPEKQHFIKPESYYATLFHECIHATGHAKRLCRKEVVETSSFGSYSYGVEELTAEMGASFLCYHAQILPQVLDNSVAYLESWLKAIKEDKRLLINASARAQKAVDYLLGQQNDE
ncbi:Antirestriction protein ArdC [Flexibacter flexilis DSM 6793]|uniref:Antirestriction protein ArdC n=1 Tax=Flexibacter flexilis DSM 6793 TaxID=927664 RepID=A0A1I1NKE9_9BACT|nr:zincin-like metallopeptidase domain-containing protein [Flexibacter flexilis]SFC94200.1 Antirestriction protein ArdC [Flexibacter flexilis DSM 6793]